MRELLDSVRASAVESVAELSAILDAANMLEEAEKEGGEVAAEARARAANAALRRGKSEERAGKALEELTNLARDSTACRIVLRQAGGIRCFSLMDQTKMTPPAAATAAASENGEGRRRLLRRPMRRPPPRVLYGPFTSVSCFASRAPSVRTSLRYTCAAVRASCFVSCVRLSASIRRMTRQGE